jgi:dTDP-4-dehydrorhamnose reductase
MLGSTAVPILGEFGYDILTASMANPRADLRVDPFSKDSMTACLLEHKFDAIINFIGATSVEACELDPAFAFHVNSAPSNVFREIVLRNEEIRTRWVQISTDHVYGDPGPSPESQIQIVNCYAASKFAGEVSARPDKDLVLRTNFVGPSLAQKRESLTDWLIAMEASGQADVPVLSDVYFSPLTMTMVGSFLAKALEAGLFGKFNVGASTGGSKADFDYLFVEKLGLDPGFMRRVETAEAKFLVARRPKDMTMDVSRVENFLGIKLPIFEEVARQAADEHRAQSERRNA